MSHKVSSNFIFSTSLFSELRTVALLGSLNWRCGAVRCFLISIVFTETFWSTNTQTDKQTSEAYCMIELKWNIWTNHNIHLKKIFTYKSIIIIIFNCIHLLICFVYSVSVSVENTIQRSQIEATRIGRMCAWSNFCLNLMLVLFQDLKYSGFEVGWILNLHNWVR